MDWQIIESGKASAQTHMDIDSRYLQTISDTLQPILRFYEWAHPSATYGYFIKPANFLDLEGVNHVGLDLGRRPTGGGIVFHLTDVAFSVIIPATHPAYSLNTLENYAFLNRHVVQALKKLHQNIQPTLLDQETRISDSMSQHFCMAKPTIYDVMLEGKKVGGAAQRRTRDGFLHQGTISLAMPDEKLLSRVLKSSASLMDAMKNYTYVWSEQEADLRAVRSRLRELLCQEFSQS